MPMTQDEFDHCRGMLAQSIGLLVGALQTRFPEGYLYDPDPDFSQVTGSAGEEPMRAIASRIYDVMETFDLLQEGLGLPAGEEPRFRRFLKGD